MGVLITRDGAFRVVCELVTPVNENEAVVGTGTFMTTDGKDAWIITAAHVARAINVNTIIAASNAEGQCEKLPLSLFGVSPATTCIHNGADIAAIPLVATPESAVFLLNRCFPLDQFQLVRQPISRDDELTIVGFPKGLSTDGMFCPLTFRSFASSSYLTLPRADTNTPCDFLPGESKYGWL